MSLPASCPLCGAGIDAQGVIASRVYGDSSGRAVFACDVCTVRYLHPGLTAEEEARLYAAEFESFMATRSASDAGWEKPEAHIRANEAQRQRRMKHLVDLVKPDARVLEIGCSSGFMLYPMAERGHDCVAIEPSGVFSDYVRSRDIPCFGSVDALEESGLVKDGFDVILHYYVMEHVADPVGFLRGQLRLLRPGGRLVFEVPNAEDALVSIYNIAKYERFIWVVSHRWYFTEGALAYLFKTLGVDGTVTLDQRYDLSNHLVWARDGVPGGMGRFTEILGPEIEDQYRQALIRARRCDTLIGTIRTPA